MTLEKTRSTQGTKSDEGRLPNFLIIGAAKSGTSSLYKYLEQHPQVYMSPIKEPQYFAYANETHMFGYNCFALQRGVAYAELPDFQRDIEAYRNLFAHTSGKHALGEASTSYPYNNKAPKLISQHIPKAKLVAILRNPIERTFSQYLMLKRLNMEPASTFEHALELEPQRIREGWADSWHYTQLGLYHQQLSRYRKYFDNHQIRVYLYEDLKDNPKELLHDLFSFLGIDENFTPNLSKKYNVAEVPRSKELDRFLQEQQPLKRAVKWLIPRQLHKSIYKKVIIPINQRANRRPNNQAMALKTKVKLTEIFRDDILKLQGLVGRDLSYWLELPKQERSS